MPAPAPGTAQIDRIDAEIIDDGVGFAADERAMGTGLRNLRDRIESLHGTLRIRSAAGRGTTIGLSLPVGGGG